MTEIEKDLRLEKAQLSIIIQQLEVINYFILNVPVENANAKQLVLEQMRSVIAALKQRA